jgi:hypothetical protein
MIDWTGLRDFRANFRLWRNIVSRKNPHEWQLTTFWYWLSYPSSEGN